MEARCFKHPTHKQSKGVCPSCLTEKLSKFCVQPSLPSTNASSTIFSSDRSPESVSDSGSTVGSPRGRLLKEVVPLTKSRSMASVVGRVEGMKEKKGFWSKFVLRRKGKGGGGLLHSNTVKDRVSATRVY